MFLSLSLNLGIFEFRQSYINQTVFVIIGSQVVISVLEWTPSSSKLLHINFRFLENVNIGTQLICSIISSVYKQDLHLVNLYSFI